MQRQSRSPQRHGVLQQVERRGGSARRLDPEAQQADDDGVERGASGPAPVAEPAERAAQHGPQRERHIGQRIERGGQPVVRLRQHGLAVAPLPKLGQVGEDQLVQIAVGGLEVQLVLGGHIGAEVEGVLVEGEVVQHPLGVEALAGAVAQHHHRHAVALGQDSLAGGVAGGLAVRGLLLDEQVLQQPALADALHVEGQAGRRLGELAGLDQARRQVGADSEQLAPHLARAPGLHPQVHHEGEKGGEDRQLDRRRDHLPPAHAGGEADDDLLLDVEPRQGDQARHEHRDRQHEREQLRDRQQHDPEKGQHVLALVDQQVEARQRLAEDRHAAERNHGGERGGEQLAEQVAFDQSHETRTAHWPTRRNRRVAGEGRPSHVLHVPPTGPQP